MVSKKVLCRNRYRTQGIGIGIDIENFWTIPSPRSESGESDAEQETRGTGLRTAALEHWFLKLVNPLESLEDRITMHIWIDFFRAPLVLTAWQQLFLFSKAEQHGPAPFVACFRGQGLCKCQGLWCHHPEKKLVVVPTSRICRH